MKKAFKKSLALLLAVFMAFGAAPLCAFGMIASAEDGYKIWPSSNTDAVEVDTVLWPWTTNSFLVDQEYSFADTYRLLPDNADNKEVVLTCTPASALQIDNEKQTFKVNPIPVGMADSNNYMQFTLTLTAKGASATCQPAIKQCKVYEDGVFIIDDPQITSVKWDYNNAGGSTLFHYYDHNLGNSVKNYHPYKYKIYSGFTVLDSSVTKMCKVTISSSDTRVVRPDDEGQQFIPVGNGTCVIFITVKTPKGTVKNDALTVVVEDAPYTPITSCALNRYDDKSVEGNITYDQAKKELVMYYGSSLKLLPELNNGAKLDQEPIFITTDDGRKINIVSEIKYEWKSDNERVAVIDKDGNLRCNSIGKATITLTIDDNGEEFEATLNVKGAMTWWQWTIYVLICILTGQWDKLPPEVWHPWGPHNPF